MIKITCILQDPDGDIIEDKSIEDFKPSENIFLGGADCPYPMASLLTFVLYQDANELHVVYQQNPVVADIAPEGLSF